MPGFQGISQLVGVLSDNGQAKCCQIALVAIIREFIRGYQLKTPVQIGNHSQYNLEMVGVAVGAVHQKTWIISASARARNLGLSPSNGRRSTLTRSASAKSF